MTFAFFPAVDIRGGKCVQLVGGVPGTEVVALDNPLGQAERWAAEGADHLHIIDLDGAILGKRVNASILSQIVREMDLFIQVGGGIRTEEDVSSILDLGVDRAILGTAALRDPDMVSRLADRHGSERIMVALDVRKGDVTTEGWQKTLGKKAVELGRLFEANGAGSILFTNIDVEGQQKGIALQPTRDLVGALHIPVVAAGGVTSVEDVLALRDAGTGGAVAGTAIYTGRLSVRAALKALQT
jgi:phosphoribosylformimino-5-aminoimidazole carboxamide ribotide isomerase